MWIGGCNYFPITRKGNCFPRSVAIYWFARRRGYPVHFHCGVRKEARSSMVMRGSRWIASPFSKSASIGNCSPLRSHILRNGGRNAGLSVRRMKTGRRCPDKAVIIGLGAYECHSESNTPLPCDASSRAVVCVAKQSDPGRRQCRGARDSGPSPVDVLYLTKLLIDAVTEELKTSSAETSMARMTTILVGLAGVAVVSAMLTVIGSLISRIHAQVVTDHMHAILQAKSVEVDLSITRTHAIKIHSTAHNRKHPIVPRRFSMPCSK